MKSYVHERWSMQLKNSKDAAYLWDMVENARMVVEFVSGIQIEDYLRDRKLQLAIERALEIIGEAARRISTHFQEKHSSIPWQKIISQRNVIAHEYGEIKQERIWTVAKINVPELIEKLEPTLKLLQDTISDSKEDV